MNTVMGGIDGLSCLTNDRLHFGAEPNAALLFFYFTVMSLQHAPLAYVAKNK